MFIVSPLLHLSYWITFVSLPLLSHLITELHQIGRERFTRSIRWRSPIDRRTWRWVVSSFSFCLRLLGTSTKSAFSIFYFFPLILHTGSLLVKFSSLLSELDVSLGSIISSLHTCLTGSVNICKTKVTTLSSVIASLSAKIEGLVKKPAPSKGHHGHSQGSSSYSGQGGFSYTQKGGLFGCLQKIFGASFGAGFKTCDK